MVNRVLFETEYWRIELNSDQAYLGRCVVVLKRECGELSGMSEEEMKDFLVVVKKIEGTMKKVFGAVMFNWTCMMNNAYKENDEVAQVHFHVRPRYDEKVEFGGEVFEDGEFGPHYDNYRREIASDKVLGEIVSALGG